jgi:hypothetical protein
MLMARRLADRTRHFNEHFAQQISAHPHKNVKNLTHAMDVKFHFSSDIVAVAANKQ